MNEKFRLNSVDKRKMSEKLRQTKLKTLRSYLGAVNQLKKFVPKLAEMCAPFMSILKKDTEWIWTEKHEKPFEQINQAIKTISELISSEKSKLRIICDASKEGLGAVLMQYEQSD